MDIRLAIERPAAHPKGTGVSYRSISFADGEDTVARMDAEKAAMKAKYGALGDPVEIDSTAIPMREFRDAHAFVGDTPEVDMPKARIIHMDRIREKRNVKLAELDQAYMRADEDGDNPGKAAIAQQKKSLRDLPANYDLSGHTTPESLKDDWPPEVL